MGRTLKKTDTNTCTHALLFLLLPIDVLFILCVYIYSVDDSLIRSLFVSFSSAATCEINVMMEMVMVFKMILYYIILYDLYDMIYILC